MNIQELKNKIESTKTKSAWNKGVKQYALELLGGFEAQSITGQALLNGASNWKEYSYGGLALINDQDIALRLCTPSELKKTNNGAKKPNKEEDWLDVQARALSQACLLILNTSK